MPISGNSKTLLDALYSHSLHVLLTTAPLMAYFGPLRSRVSTQKCIFLPAVRGISYVLHTNGKACVRLFMAAIREGLRKGERDETLHDSEAGCCPREKTRGESWPPKKPQTNTSLLSVFVIYPDREREEGLSFRSSTCACVCIGTHLIHDALHRSSISVNAV